MDLTDAAVENLVTQFSSAYDFYRELVQNSIDAGSDAVEVWTEFSPGEGGGTIAIHVDDFGEGMNEEIIDQQLTRLFASSKENDLTKIGKFGIGFVSVFALAPKAVMVHTGRGGECWEVLFHEDRSFSKTRVDTPVEGTQITLFLAGDRIRYREIVVESRRTLRHWCGHSDVEVTFEDRSSARHGEGVEVINRPFAVEGECSTELVVEETHIVLAYTRAPVYGFYNRGLALAVVEGETDLVPGRLRHVTFKIKSRYLEHTLSRETVMRDRNYDKAMQLVLRAADVRLFAALVTRLRTHVESTGAWGLLEIESYLELVEYLSREPFEPLTRHEKVPLLRTVDGRAVSLSQVFEASRRDGHVYVSDAATPLTDQLTAMGVPVVLGRGVGQGTGELVGDGVVRLLRAYVEDRSTRGIVGFLRARLAGSDLQERIASMIVAPEQVLLSVDVIEPHEAGAAALLAAAHRVLEDSIVDATSPVVRRFGEAAVEGERPVELGYARLLACRVTSRVPDPPLFVVGRTVGPLMARPPAGGLAPDRASRPEAAVDVGHPHFRAMLQLWPTQPRIAAYCMAKALLLSEDRLLSRDIDLIEAAQRLSDAEVGA